jgi:hypothetical protein
MRDRLLSSITIVSKDKSDELFVKLFSGDCRELIDEIDTLRADLSRSKAQLAEYRKALIDALVELDEALLQDDKEA